MKQINVYKVDLTRIKGSGDFSCPHCGNAISPDDATEETYTILDTKVSHRGLDEIVIQCRICASIIHLTGFSLLHDIAENAETGRVPKTQRQKRRQFT